MKDKLLREISKVERLAGASRLGRLLHNPSKYLSAIFFGRYVYPKTRMERIETAELFFGKSMKIALPAATDIYLTGGKSHDSEIRLAKFIINTLQTGDHFLDIGAHYGYFSLIASALVGPQGKIFSYEPATNSFELLQQNAAGAANMSIFRQAVSDSNESIVFYEFPNKYSEYNTMDVSQFENESWYQTSKPTRVEVAATTIDSITSNGLYPAVIKIDVEGAEFSVMKGAAQLLRDGSPYIVMEYLEPRRHNEQHQNALQLLLDNGFKTFVIDKNGELNSIGNIDHYLLQNKMESDNIVFKKS